MKDLKKEKIVKSEMSAGTMLVAFDGSPSSLAALQWAHDHAELLHLEVKVVHIWEYAETALDVAGIGFGSAGFIGESDPKAWSEQILINGVAQVYGEHATGVSAESIEGGVVKTLVELSKSAALMVIGSRGHGKFADLILGSVSESCSAKSKCPVVIVHAPTNAL